MDKAIDIAFELAFTPGMWVAFGLGAMICALRYAYYVYREYIKERHETDKWAVYYAIQEVHPDGADVIALTVRACRYTADVITPGRTLLALSKLIDDALVRRHHVPAHGGDEAYWVYQLDRMK